MTLREEIIKELIKGKIPSPRLEADIILKAAAPAYPDIKNDEQQKAYGLLKRRLNHEPLDKIIGQREFYKSVFKVNQDVLSPRPDTEILVEKALELLPQDEPLRILDLGTGSGCILLSLLKERPKANGVGVDVSEKALAVAKENAKNLGLENQVSFINKSWQEKGFVTGLFEMVVSNPPYIPSAEINTLDEEVKNHDPLTALDGGADGLQCYRDIAAMTPDLLKDNGFILLEVGYDQAEAVADIFVDRGLCLIDIIKDLAGINRCVILKKSVAK